MNPRRPVLTGSLAIIALLTGAPAHADPAEGPVACAVTGTSPEQVSVGIVPEPVQFAVRTDCDGEHGVNWTLFSDQYRGSGASWLMLRNWDQPGGEKYTPVESPEGYFTVDPVHHGVQPGNAMAGRHPLYVAAFTDLNGDNFADGPDEVMSFAESSFRLLRATTFTGGVQASPAQARRHEPLRLTASLQRANWDTAAEENLGAWVTLQFRRSGKTRWKTVQRVWNDGRAEVTVRAKRSGDWRYVYDGDDVSGATTSESLFVPVSR